MADENYTHLALVVDRSGSMATIAKDMDGGIETLLKEQALEKGRITVDVTTFDTVVEEKHTRVGPLDVKYPIVQPRGGTALNDAIGVSVARVKAWEKGLSKAERPGKVIFVIVTDGQENSSQEYTNADIKALVKQAPKRWTFLFLGANIDAFAVGRGYGFDSGTTMQYRPGAQSVGVAYAATSGLVSSLRSGNATTGYTDEQREAAK